ncbi:MAG: OadG family transporter subunit [Verrucomicrobiia bacterium]
MPAWLLYPGSYLPTLGLLDRDAPFSEVVAYQLAAIAVVIFSLTALWFLCELIGLWFRRSTAKKTDRAAATRGKQQAFVLRAEDEMRLTAVIAAAVVVVCGPRVAIRGIVDATTREPVNPNLLAWTLQGRLQHHGSHSLR